MDSRFTNEARAALKCAHEVAREAGYTYVGSEHLIAGILKDGSSVAAEALENSGVVFEEFMEKVKEISPPDSSATVIGASLPITPRCKTILEMSFNEAKKTDRKSVV